MSSNKNIAKTCEDRWHVFTVFPIFRTKAQVIINGCQLLKWLWGASATKTCQLLCWSLSSPNIECLFFWNSLKVPDEISIISLPRRLGLIVIPKVSYLTTMTEYWGGWEYRLALKLISSLCQTLNFSWTFFWSVSQILNFSCWSFSLCQLKPIIIIGWFLILQLLGTQLLVDCRVSHSIN